ncbi:MAG: hypothetical protein BWY63_03746 [Chloroflexi bacterium ADurb.Bin360]|nr:MAG: hypothetical protein BWY63_03746 [Chloroflexi bacterium ADurb.Bin360]
MPTANAVGDFQRRDITNQVMPPLNYLPTFAAFGLRPRRAQHREHVRERITVIVLQGDRDHSRVVIAARMKRRPQLRAPRLRNAGATNGAGPH